jgi:hypothetical protein
MQIAAILRRWIETLVTVFKAWHEPRREQHALTVAYRCSHPQTGKRSSMMCGCVSVTISCCVRTPFEAGVCYGEEALIAGGTPPAPASTTFTFATTIC